MIDMMHSYLLLFISVSSTVAASELCLNNDNYIHPNTTSLTCRKIRFNEDMRRNFCQKELVRNNCPVSCGLCCDDDPDYIFETNAYGNVNCKLIQTTEGLKDRFCDKFKNGIMVKNACSVGCENCPLEVSPNGEIIDRPIEDEEEDGNKNSSDAIYIGVALGSSAVLLASYVFVKKRKSWVVQVRSAYEKRKKQKRSPSYDKLLKERREALLLQEENLGMDHVENAAIHFDIGTLLKAKGKKKLSLESFWSAVALLKQAYGKNNINVAASYCNLAEVYLMQKDYDRSFRSYKKALFIHDNLSGKKNSNSALIYMKIGSVQKKAGNLNESLKFTRTALGIEKRVSGGRNHVKTILMHNQLGSILHAKKDYKSAFTEYRYALEILIDALERNYSRGGKAEYS